MATRRIHVMVTTNHHSPRDAQYYASREVRLTIASSDTRRLIQAALWGLRGIYCEGFRYKKCGVVFLDLVPAAGVQGNLFLTPDSPRRQAVMAAMDKLNNRFGKDCVRLACSGLAEARDWWTKADFLSLRRTTRWAELLTVCHCCYICYQLRWHNQKGGGMAKNVDDAFLTFAGWLKATTT